MLQDKLMNNSFDEWFLIMSFTTIFVRGLMELGGSEDE